MSYQIKIAETLAYMRGLLLSAILLVSVGNAGQALAQEVAPMNIILEGEERLGGRVALSLTRISDGKTLYSHRPDQPMIPASVVKVLSTGAAMRVLGASYRFPTQVYMIGEVRGDTLDGALLLRGGIDPSVASRLIPRDTLRLSSELAMALRLQGVRYVRGGLHIDGSMERGLGPHPSWEAEDIGLSYGAGVYGFNYRDNYYDLYLRTSTRIGSNAEIVGRDSLGGITWINSLKAGTREHIDRYLIPMKPEVRLEGTLPRGRQAIHLRVASPSPAHYAGQHLKAELEHRGIAIQGEVHTSYVGYELEGRLIHTYYSRRLDTLSIIANHRSNNLYAEAIAAAIDPRLGGGPAVQSYWQRRLKLSPEAMYIVDGSGLSRANRMTATAMTHILIDLFGGLEPHDGALVGALPQVGLDGTVRRLMPAGELTAYLKSGTMRGVACYAGYIYHRGEWYTLTYLSNDMPSAAASRRVLTSFLRAVFGGAVVPSQEEMPEDAPAE